MGLNAQINTTIQNTLFPTTYKHVCMILKISFNTEVFENAVANHILPFGTISYLLRPHNAILYSHPVKCELATKHSQY